METSIFYRSPLLYQCMLSLVYGKHLKRRYQIIAQELSDAKTVFEPMCGPALLPDYLSKRIDYSGFDINPWFVQYAQKKGHTVGLGDVRNPEYFRGVKADGVVLIDAVHHLWPYEEQQKVVERSAQVATKKLIICDPYGDRYLKILERFPSLRKPAEWIFNWMESDGPNKSRFDHMVDRETLESRMSAGYGVLRGVQHKLQQVGHDDLIATYYLSD